MRRLLLLGVWVIFLASCTHSSTPSTTTPSDTQLPPTGTFTPTLTQLPSRTLLPTWTPKSVVSPSPTITPPSVQPVALSPLALNENNAGTEMNRLAVFGTGKPTDMAWSPDGRTFAVATTRGVWLYDGETIEERGFIDVNDKVDAMAFSPDGQVLALGVRGQVSLWSVVSKQKIKDIPSDLKYIYSLAYGKGGQIAVLGAFRLTDSGDYLLKLWDGKSGEEIFSKNILWFFTPPVFSPDGTLLAYYDNGVKLIDSKTAALIS